MMVPHDTPIEVTITCNAQGHSKPCAKYVVPAYQLDADATVQAVMHGKVSGMDSGIRVRRRIRIVEQEATQP